MALKKTDFTINRGIEKLQYQRGCKINDKSTNLTVILVKNYKKGFYHIETKWNAEQITGQSADDQATLKTLSELAMAASRDGEEWKKEWHDNQPKDENQTEMFNEDGDGEIGMGFKDEE